MKIETIEHKGHKIDIIQDECAENPIDFWDCMPEVYSTGNYKRDKPEPPELTSAQIKSNISELLRLTGGRSLLAFAGRYCYRSDYLTATDMINDAIGDHLSGLSDGDRFDAIAALYGMAGILAISEGICGYSQGDYQTVLSIASNEWIESTGIQEEYAEKALKSSIETYAAWAYGDVYGYSIESIGESCFGFYGAHGSDGYNDMMENARLDIDCYLIRQERKRRAKLISLIKSRTPLELRRSILDNVA